MRPLLLTACHRPPPRDAGGGVGRRLQETATSSSAPAPARTTSMTTAGPCSRRSIRRPAAARGGRLRLRPQRRALHDRLRRRTASSASWGPRRTPGSPDRRHRHRCRSPSASPATATSTSATRRTRSSLRRFSGAGTPISHVLAGVRPAALIDLSADQRTIFYTDSHQPDAAGRASLRRRRPAPNLPDFADLGGTDAHRRRQAAAAGRRQRRRDRRADDDDQARERQRRRRRTPTTGRARTRGSGSRSIPTASRSGPRPPRRAASSASTSPAAPSTAARSPPPASAFGICVKGTPHGRARQRRPEHLDLHPRRGRDVPAGPGREGRVQRAQDDANGTGINRCTGTVPSGAPIDTGTPGTKTFTVEAVDNAGNGGNTTTASRTYTVAAPAASAAGALKRIIVTLSSNFPSVGRTIRFTRLVVKNVPRGSTRHRDVPDEAGPALPGHQDLHQAQRARHGEASSASCASGCGPGP